MQHGSRSKELQHAVNTARATVYIHVCGVLTRPVCIANMNNIILIVIMILLLLLLLLLLLQLLLLLLIIIIIWITSKFSGSASPTLPGFALRRQYVPALRNSGACVQICQTPVIEINSSLSLSLSLCIYIYIYIYIHTCIHMYYIMIYIYIRLYYIVLHDEVLVARPSHVVTTRATKSHASRNLGTFFYLGAFHLSNLTIGLGQTPE